ncbi:hypothetical protein [Rhodocaloribacter sp.]
MGRRIGAIMGAVLFAVLLGAGCDGGALEAPPLDGRFEGAFVYAVDGAEFAEPWSVGLRENDGRIAGEGALGTTPVTVEGEHHHPDVTLHFTDVSGDFAGVFSGLLAADGTALEGTYTFSIIFVDAAVVLRRSR